MDPREIRQSVREKRRQMDASVRAAASQQIGGSIADRIDFQSASNIALFLAFDGEPDLNPLITTAWERDQRVFLPIVHGKGHPMSFAACEKNTNLVPNRYGIMEPDAETAHMIRPTELDCVLVPLVAFDAQCHRIGVGGGFYDRTFAFKRAAAENRAEAPVRPTMIGVAYEFQEVELIEPQLWDVPLDTIVTETAVYP